jgi:methylated-DNA-[protein]-cysteine S-methyltransferase
MYPCGMSPVFIHTLAVPWGRASFQFDACGVLVELELDSQRGAGMHGKRPAGAPSASALKSWLAAFLNGSADAFPGQWKMPGTTSFQKKIYQATAAIPRGKVRTYGELAAKAGSPGAARAVGTCMASNPMPLLVPCHRVVGAHSGLGGFSGGGLPVKLRLLRAEQVDYAGV